MCGLSKLNEERFEENRKAYVLGVEKTEQELGESFVVGVNRWVNMDIEEEKIKGHMKGVSDKFHRRSEHLFWERQLGEGKCVYCRSGSQVLNDGEFYERVREKLK
jgi:hypothetical protein